ncbi:MAG: hydrogenase maturation protease [Planctomycetes bacterium]|nr:hydrogenase maturation protease [Planctomycetota bacterium]
MPEHPTIVIACGNRLRGDDGLGPAAAEIVQRWLLPGVKVIIVHQFVPELIDDIKDGRRLLFIDAAVSSSGNAFDVRDLEPERSRRVLGHHDTPASLLALLRDLEGRTPEAVLLTVAGYSFDHGTKLTPVAEENLNAALSWIRSWLLS